MEIMETFYDTVKDYHCIRPFILDSSRLCKVMCVKFWKLMLESYISEMFTLYALIKPH